MPSSLYSTLNGMSLNNSVDSTNDWFLDTGASSHMASHPSILTNCSPSIVPRSICIGNGGLLSVSSTGRASIPTSSTPLHLNNVLIAPQLVKNLKFVRALTRDNFVPVEFDPWGFSIKDLRTRMALLQCDSSGKLYPLRIDRGDATPRPS
jgi:hypothetical protein